PAVGFVFDRTVGGRVKRGEPIVWVHSDDPAKTRESLERLRRAITIGDTAPEEKPLVVDRVG
ncbi:MAG: thymidine phosphorylase, partial [Deltaproteobacteria bacterium]